MGLGSSSITTINTGTYPSGFVFFLPGFYPNFLGIYLYPTQAGRSLLVPSIPDTQARLVGVPQERSPAIQRESAIDQLDRTGSPSQLITVLDLQEHSRNFEPET